MSLYVTYSISLESYNPYLQSQKNSKNPKIHCIHSNLPKKCKESFWPILGPFGLSSLFSLLPNLNTFPMSPSSDFQENNLVRINAILVTMSGHVIITNELRPLHTRGGEEGREWTQEMEVE